MSKDRGSALPDEDAEGKYDGSKREGEGNGLSVGVGGWGLRVGDQVRGVPAAGGLWLVAP